MKNRTILRRTLALILGSTMICGAATGFAFDMGNMMNPSKWMGGNRDRGYGYGGPGGYGGGPGYGYGGPSGYGSPGAYAVPPTSAPSSAASPPNPNPSVYGSPYPGAGGQSEIDSLRERIRALEGAGHR